MRRKLLNDEDNEYRQQYRTHNNNNNYYNNSNYNNNNQSSPSHSPQMYQQIELPNSLQRIHRTQSQNSSQGNTIDMVKLVNRRENNRISKMNNYREVYKGYYNDRAQHVNNNKRRNWLNNDKDQYANNNQHHQQKQKREQQQQTFNSPNYNPLSPTLRSIPSLQKSHSHRIQSRQSMPFRPSQIQLLYDMDTSPRNKVIGYLLLIVFVVFCLQVVFVGGYFLSENYIVYSDDNHVQRFKVYEQSGSKLNELYSQNVFVTVLLIYSLAQLLYHAVVYWIDYKNSINNTNPTHIFNKKLIDQQTSTLSYILHCRDITRQSNTFIQKLIKNPKFTIFIILLCVILSCYGIVVCYYYSQLNSIWVVVQQQSQYGSYGLLQMIVFVIVMPQVMGYLFFERMHVVGSGGGGDNVNINNESNNNNNFLIHNNNDIRLINVDNQQQQQQKEQQQHLTHPLTSPFSTQHQHHHHQPHHHIQTTTNTQQTSIHPPLPLTTFNTNKWHYKLSLVILLATIIYSILTTKYWLCIVMIAKIEILFVKCKYRIDVFYVQVVSKVVVFLVAVGVLVCLRVSNMTTIDDLNNVTTNIAQLSQQQQQQQQQQFSIPLTTIIFTTIITTISLLTYRLLASHYIRQQLYKHLIQQQSMISSNIIGSILITYFLYSYVVVDFIQMDYLSYGLMVLLQLGMLISLFKQGRQREEILFHNDLQQQRQSDYYIQMDRYL